MENSQSDDQQMVSGVESKMVSGVESKMVSDLDKKPIFTKFLDSGEDSLLETSASVPQEVSLEDQTKTPKHGQSWYKKPWIIGIFGLLILLFTILIWLGIVGYQTYQKSKVAATHAQAVATAFEARDLGLAKSELSSTKTAVQDAHSVYKRAMPLKFIPLLGAYIKDGDHAFVAVGQGVEAGELAFGALEPYADVLGFTGAGTKLEFTSAEERIIFLAETVERLAPQMDSISSLLKKMDSELQSINEKRYPEIMAGYEVKGNIAKIKKPVSSTSQSIESFQPFITILPDLLGNPDPRKYFILFQNDAELRPTGGFMTAYATMTVTRGKIEAGVSEDIYTLDNAFKTKVPAPDPILKYLPLVYNWNLRDMNLSPDFKVSMDTFSKYYKTVPGAPEADAIIAIDTEVPVRLLEALGPIGVPGYGGKFSAEPDPRCDGNCPQVIYELENIITRPTYEIREGRKSILGPLMNSMLANMMGSPKTKWPEFFTIFTDAIREKHLLMYFYNEDKQKAVEALGAAGRITEYTADYLHVNDTNFAGAKSNLFVEQEVSQEVNVGGDGSVTKKLILTYKNPMRGSNCNLEAGQLCLNGLLRDWIRIYVPKGATLVASRGFEVDMETSEDLGKTVFESFFTLSPESVKKLEVEYKLPSGTITGDYQLLIQKQPGTDMVKHTITVNGGKPYLYSVNSDQEIVIPR